MCVCGDVFGWDFRFYTEMVMFWVKDRKLWNWVLFCGNSKNGQIDKIWSLLSFLDLVLAVVFFRLIVNLIRYWIYYLNIVVIYEKILVFYLGNVSGSMKNRSEIIMLSIVVVGCLIPTMDYRKTTMTTTKPMIVVQQIVIPKIERAAK